jgi:microcystin-dependent protein
MANYEQTKYDISGANMTGLQGVSTGLIIPWSTGTAPSGFLECDGTAISRSTYSALFAIISTTYGIGDGTTTFNLPDLRDKTVVHRSNNKALASTMGANTVTPTGNVGGNSGSTTLTTPEIAAHTHGTTGAGNAQGGGGSEGGGSFAQRLTAQTSATGGAAGHTHAVSGSFTGSSMSVVQPFITVMYIIKT